MRVSVRGAGPAGVGAGQPGGVWVPGQTSKDETALYHPGPQPGTAASPGLGFPMGTLTWWVHGNRLEPPGGRGHPGAWPMR